MAANTTPKKQDADYVFYELTRSICPKCLEPIDAQILIRDGRVVMRKRCASHGWFEALVSSDAEMYLGSLPYNKPGTIRLATARRSSTAAPRTAASAPSTSSTPVSG